jgi:pheromone shutdown protein TraB
LPLILVALIAAGFIRYGASLGGDLVLRWLLLNGSLSALGSLVALAHPLAILVSFVGAPLGTLSPVLSIGMISGIVQAIVRKPRVEDAETLSDSITSLKGLYRNRITRALLVFFLSSIGGATGNLIAVPALAAKIF